MALSPITEDELEHITYLKATHQNIEWPNYIFNIASKEMLIKHSAID